jgi:hypothetical protein
VAWTMIGVGRPLMNTAEGCALGVWGVLIFLASGVCGIQNSEGRRRALEMLPSDIPELGGWLDEERGMLVLVTNQSEEVFVVDLGMDELRSSIRLEREPNVGHRHLMLFRLADDLLGCAYEGGVLAIGDSGSLRWHAVHHNPGVTMRSVTDDVIWLENQWPRSENDRVIGIAIADGAFL